MNEYELYHYGVLGMKWGVRRNSSKAFYKATRKANKIREKEVATNLKAAKLRSKSLKKEMSATNQAEYSKALKMKFKANKLALKSAKLQKKGDRWINKMEDNFKETKASDISSEHIETGKQYMYMLMNK